MSSAPETPLITAGITCFNAEDTVERAVRSALAQDWPALEIIVVDDCSTDPSAAIVERIAESEERVRLVRHSENLGPGGARQTLLENARGEYLAFFDDDDVSKPDRLTVQYRRLVEAAAESGEGPAACYASGVRIYENGYRMKIDAIGSKPRIPTGEETATHLLFNGRVRGVFYGAGTPACALMASVETMKEVGGFDPAFRRVEDADFAVRLGLTGGRFIGCPERLYTQYATTAPDKSAEKNFRAELLLLEKHRDHLEKKRRYDFARRWFTIRYHHFNGDHGRAAGEALRCLLRHPLLTARQMLTTVPARAAHERRTRDGADRP